MDSAPAAAVKDQVCGDCGAPCDGTAVNEPPACVDVWGGGSAGAGPAAREVPRRAVCVCTASHQVQLQLMLEGINASYSSAALKAWPGPAPEVIRPVSPHLHPSWLWLCP